MKASCVIVDDEHLAIRVLQNYAERSGKLDVAATFRRPDQALEYLRAQPVDVLFLDIQMPGLDGMSLLRKLPMPPLVVFTTARHDHAVQAFELEALDYLVKPIPFERFDRAVNRALERLEARLAENPSDASTYLEVRSEHRTVRIPYDDICRVEGFGEYVRVHTAAKVWITLASLKDLEEVLPSGLFARVHKQHIVALREVRSHSSTEMELSDGSRIPIGRTYRGRL